MHVEPSVPNIFCIVFCRIPNYKETIKALNLTTSLSLTEIKKKILTWGFHKLKSEATILVLTTRY